MPQAQGWAARAQRLAEEFPDSPVHGWMAWMQGLVAWFQSDFDAAIAAYDGPGSSPRGPATGISPG